MPDPPGVSLILCCHNSAARIVPTLTHLARQNVRAGTRWEVILVDNGSTDDTAGKAQAAWPKDTAPLFRIVEEPRIGLTHARVRGLKEARYEFVSFVDDDNWVAADWVEMVIDIFSAHPQCGACGGYVEAEFEATPPTWFGDFAPAFVTGAQVRHNDSAGDVGVLWGAGLTVRKSAWKQLIGNGFEPVLTDRQARKMTAGGDHELCFALRLAGWTLRYDPRLRMKHFLPKDRLKWKVLRAQARGAGAAYAILAPYHHAVARLETHHAAQSLVARIKEKWSWQVLAGVKQLLRRPLAMMRMQFFQMEGSETVARLEVVVGRLITTIKSRTTYRKLQRTLRSAKWAKS
jgi:glycosyltransferase involved in cell wall biosynthesis